MDDATDGEIEQRQRRSAIEALYGILSSLRASRATVELFLSWEGDQRIAPKERTTLTPENFLAASFPMVDGQLATIT